MIPFGTGDIPISPDEAARRVTDSITSLLRVSKSQPSVSCEMSSPEQIKSLQIDLSNVDSSSARAEKPGSLLKIGNTVLQNFKVSGNPLVLYGALVQVNVNGSDIPATWSRDDSGAMWLVPSMDDNESAEKAASGNVEISSRAAAVEAALRAAVGELAEANGARLKDLRLRLESAGPRGLLVAVDVAAVKFMMTAKVRALAEASLDDDMNLRIGNVEVSGDGAAGTMVANFLAGKAAQWRGREISLSQYMFAGAALRDVQMQVGEELRLSARFGQ